MRKASKASRKRAPNGNGLSRGGHAARKSLHLLSVLAVPADILAHDLTLYALTAMFAFYLAIAYMRARQRHVPGASNIVNWLSREDEKGGMLGPPTYLFISVIFLLAFVPQFAAYVGIISVAVGDTFAMLAGSLVKGKKMLNEKTLAGTFGFFIPTFVVFYFLLGFDRALILAAAGALAELLSHRYDNLTVPFITAAVAALIF